MKEGICVKEKSTILVATKKSTHIESIRAQLKSKYSILMAGTARAAIVTIDQLQPSLILIGTDLPGMVGLALIKNLRKHSAAPIIVLSESSEEHDIVTALDAGANDVLVLPFGRPEHHARIRAALRYGSNTPCVDSGGFTSSGLSVNYATRTVTVDGEKVHLTPIEFRIMTLLTINAGKVLTHDQIINEIWGPYNSDNLVLRVNMANIRRKIESNPAEPVYIVTEVGVGYKVVVK